MNQVERQNLVERIGAYLDAKFNTGGIRREYILAIANRILEWLEENYTITPK